MGVINAIRGHVQDAGRAQKREQLTLPVNPVKEGFPERRCVSWSLRPGEEFAKQKTVSDTTPSWFPSYLTGCRFSAPSSAPASEGDPGDSSSSPLVYNRSLNDLF